ncbi:TPA: lipid-A-disaccharide synthase [Candidatus Avigastranaerophilus faecigallinarum]|nr:lipid-A-disaccharide synthase [Candidatus Avigastranaerophilus faecigallinarum]
MKKLFIITGEYSGDRHAADVVKEIKRISPDMQIEAVGGSNLADAGVKLYCDHSKMSAMGFNMSIILTHINLGKKIASYLKNEYKPDMVLMVDYGGFNLNLSKVLSKYGFKIYYYIPPQIWASRKWRLNTVKKNINKVLTIFPFEKEMYDKIGVDAEFVGHPLLSEIPDKVNKTEFFAKNDFDIDKKLVSIFPGSRKFEINNLLKLFLESAKLLKEKNPNIQFALAQAPSIKDELINPVLEKYKDLNIKVLKNKNYELLSSSDALILASGTVALEAALYNTPMIISYKGPMFLYLIYMLVRCIKRVCLPNIIMNQDIVPEILQFNAKPKIIFESVNKILNDEEYKNKMIQMLKNVKQKLSTSGAAHKTAEIIVNNI